VLVSSFCVARSASLFTDSCGMAAWGSPLVFTIIWTWVTVVWVRRSLRKEKEMWVAKSGAAVPEAAFSH